MILPTTYSGALLCLLVSMLCWGSWANLQKLAGKWRYELFFWDFSFGIALAAAVAAFTLGSMNDSELTFQDNLLIASYHKISFALESGVLFNLSNVLLVAALSVAPISVAVPIAMGVGVVIGTGWLLFPPQGSALILLSGAVLVLAAVVVNAFTFSTYTQDQRTESKPFRPDPRAPGAALRPPLPAKGIALSVASGIFIGLIPPLTTAARSGEDGLGAYSAALLCSVAALASTFIFAPFFITFPVHGAPVQLRAYFRGAKGSHLYGLLAGVVWGIGLIASFASGGTLATVQAGPVPTLAFAEGSAILAAFWGLLVWREFCGGTYRSRILLITMLVLWIVGAGLVTVAPDLAK